MKYIIVFVYTAINIFLLILNWNLFTSAVNMDFGFDVIRIAPLIFLQFLGLFALIVFAVIDGFKDLKREVVITDLQKKMLKIEKDSEISSLKKIIQSNEQLPKKEKVVAEVVK